MHTAIVVRDLEEAIAFYEEMGFTRGDSFNLKSIGVRLGYMYMGDTVLELIEDNGDVENHVAIEVPCVECWLEEHDVVYEKEIMITEWGKRAIFFRGINGELIEVIGE